MSTNKWILNVPNIHLGNIKESFERGSVIEETENSLIINGREFSEKRDLGVLLRQSKLNPESPWVIPYTDDNYYQVLYGGQPQAQARVPKREHQQLRIEQHDTYYHDPIVNSHTRATEQVERQRSDHMPIIRGDMTAQERQAEQRHNHEAELARLAESNDIRDIERRVELKAQPWKPKIVVDEGSERVIPIGNGPRPQNVQGIHFDRNTQDAVFTATQMREAARTHTNSQPRDIDYELHGQALPGQELDNDLYDEVTPAGRPTAMERRAANESDAVVQTQNNRIDALEQQIGSLTNAVQSLIGALSPVAATSPVEESTE